MRIRRLCVRAEDRTLSQPPLKLALLYTTYIVLRGRRTFPKAFDRSGKVCR